MHDSVACCVLHIQHVPADAFILLNSGATSNFVSPRLLKQLAVNYSPSSATLRLADASSVPIVGRTRLHFKLQSLSCTVSCYVTVQVSHGKTQYMREIAA